MTQQAVTGLPLAVPLELAGAVLALLYGQFPFLSIFSHIKWGCSRWQSKPRLLAYKGV